MNGRVQSGRVVQAVLVLGVCSWVTRPYPAASAGVTIITHGLNGDTDGWVTGMANQANYERFLGTNYSSYHAYCFYSAGSYFLTAVRDAGSGPLAPESGEIILKLDWRQLADGNSYNTYQFASAVVPALLSTNFITELGGHAVAELPIHLIGHSRGGSLICEISRQLGTNGIWIDHLTALDPHPLNNDGFFDLIYSAVHAPAYSAIRDGYNQWWDLGAGNSNNRTVLPANNGSWPNLVKFNRTATNQVVQGDTMPVTFSYQWAMSNTDLATLSVYLDGDLNSFNTNQTLVEQVLLPGSGAAFVDMATTNLTIFTPNASPGSYAVLAKITGGGRTRYLYAPEQVVVMLTRQSPLLDIAKIAPTYHQIGVNGEPGQMVVLQSSTDVQAWYALATNTLAANRWNYTNGPLGEAGRRFYRAVLP